MRTLNDPADRADLLERVGRLIAEVDQDRDGTRPEVFEADRDRLVETATRFAEELDPDSWTHPAFGSLSCGEWGRWGWRHMDRHLRQFGV